MNILDMLKAKSLSIESIITVESQKKNNVDLPFCECSLGELWHLIFDAQSRLMDKYEAIEYSNGIGHAVVPHGLAFDLDSRFWQAYIKDLCWRATEEIVEAREAYLFHAIEGKAHLLDELSDVTHFIVELLITARVPKDLLFSELESRKPLPYRVVPSIPPDIYFFNPIVFLGLAANCLKNKPWKNSHIKIDSVKFYQKLIIAFHKFRDLCGSVGMDDYGIAALYFLKNDVNHFRINTNY